MDPNQELMMKSNIAETSRKWSGFVEEPSEISL